MIELLKDSYLDAIRPHGLGAFMRMVRTDKNDFSGKYNCGLKVISKLFSPSVWTHVSGPGGHITVKHKITGVVIDFSNHKDPVDPGAVRSIAEKVQEHLNILGNDIFHFPQGSWKIAPDFEKIAKAFPKRA